MTPVWMTSFPLPRRVVELARLAEDSGYAGLGFTDTQNLAPDVYSSLTLAAGCTERLLLRTSVTNPVTRHPSVTANAIATVDLVSDGRAVLGIGRGDSSVATIDRPLASVADFESYVREVKSYLLGSEDGTVPARNRWIDGAGRAVPVDIAATGPKVMAVAARQADAVTVAVGADPGRILAARAAVEVACEAAGRDPRDVAFGAHVNVVVHPDGEVARAIGRGPLAVFARFSAMTGRAAPDVDPVDRGRLEQLAADYRMDRHATGAAAPVPDDLLDRFGILGTPDSCAERLAGLRNLGLDHLVVIGPAPDAPFDEVERAWRTLGELIQG
ncbi:LLM class flavin-dependent oxidoreductase [Blastococcus tunisiensis]|uniref:5,10-methylenetetrahydromethanopterin reductase n=1 Tax=Blastococcus tunisiensis TaxID=1798228 RepID=A0A1I1ZDK0_9ACTN|nr:LLM class flavin-dependent oxidoreductase [Blastococcus sp. DSM 46838]SFE29662.1 5,10-methylenetetrahydromethanopterin reductase [Blastococcus sp. DSM 46838]